MERQSKGPTDLEAYCSGGQGPPRAVAPTDDDDDGNVRTTHRDTVKKYSFDHLCAQMNTTM